MPFDYRIRIPRIDNNPNHFVVSNIIVRDEPVIYLTEEIRREESALSQSMRDEMDRVLSAAFQQQQTPPWETVAVPCAPLTLETLRRVQRIMRRDDSGKPIMARKSFLNRRGRRTVEILPAVCRSGRSSAYVFNAVTGESIGLNMFTMKDCDEEINWDSAAMAKRPRQV